MFNTIAILKLILCSTIAHVAISDFAGCDKETFYSFLQGNATNQNNMHDLIRNMHRNSLPYKQVWDGKYYYVIILFKKKPPFILN